ncbi:MAG: hypothetical protein JWM95_1971 [Gemmatimonadetes bacterium]|nr:hypothetical protein [Gemmatimonadota bacterium]
MPFEQAFDGPIIVTRFHGTLSNNDLVRMSDMINELERTLDVAPHRLTDLRGVRKIEVHYPDVQGFADRRTTVTIRNSVRAAIVVATPREFGFARMFQTLNNNPKIDVEVFTDEQAARDWIAAAP